MSNINRKTEPLFMVSVIIPVCNSESTLSKCIESILNQNYPVSYYEIILIDNGSTDNSLEIIKSYDVIYDVELKKGPAAARNCGIKNAKGDILIFTDSDCVVGRNFITNFVNLFIKYQRQGIIEPVIGGGITGINQNFWAYCDDICSWYRFNSKLPGRKEKSFLLTANLCLKKTLYNKIGPFDDDLLCSEDFAYCRRLLKNGYKLYFEPSVKVKHINRNSFNKFMNHTKSWTTEEFKLQEKNIINKNQAPLLIFVFYYIIYFILKIGEIIFYLLLARRFLFIFIFPIIVFNRFHFCWCRFKECLKVRKYLLNK